MARARFVHTADLHLGRPLGFLPPQLANERRRDQRRALAKIVDTALERGADMLLVAGDLFDSPDPDPTDVEAVMVEFTRFTDAGRLIFAIPGNHDYARPNGIWQRLNSSKVHVFMDTSWDTVLLEDMGVAVCGTAFERGGSGRRAFDGFHTPDLPCIALVHASLEHFQGQMNGYHPFSAGDLEAAGVNYAALGHYHSCQPIETGSALYAGCYPGTPEGISFDSPELGDRFAIYGEVEDDGSVTTLPLKTNTRTMLSADIDCTSFDTQGSLFDAVRKYCQANNLVHLKLSGMPAEDVASVLEELSERFKESCHYISIDTSGILASSDIAEGDLTIRGRFSRHMKKTIEEAADPEAKRLLARALELGMAAFREE